MKYTMPPGKYCVTVHSNGAMDWKPLPSRAQDRTYRSLEDIWLQDGPFTLVEFEQELNRQNLLTNENQLLFTGGQLKGCYYYLRNTGVLPDINMTEVFQAFSKRFKLKFNHERSLQTHDYNPNDFAGIFSFFVFSRNENVDR